jgi:hypothetical protein
MVKNSALVFVGVLIVLYFLLTYSYNGYTPNFPVETRNRHFLKKNGVMLETESVADVAIDSTICGVKV